MTTTPDSYISYFTPSEMTSDTLEFIFVKREKLAERLVDRVRDSVLTPAKYHNLLIGPRGMGKSHMVALVYHRVKALPELEGKIALAWLAEEEWSVAALVDFYVVILDALQREYGGLQDDIDALYSRPLDERTDAAQEMIRTFVGERTLFLLVENLEEIFNGLDSDELWSLRSFLSETPFVTILATTPSLFRSITKQKEAFFGFFQQNYLDELTAQEATELLGKLAERRKDENLSDFLKTSTALDRVQAVHDLAGGHPRIYLLFAHLLTQPSLDELVTPFLEFLDELTPYYQDKMKSLSPQQRKIVSFLSDRRGAVAVKDIVARTNGLTSQTASGQLDKLDEMGFVRKNKVGRESHYELREPLLRMVLEKKRGRGEPIRLVVDFLRRWYTRAERRARLNNAIERNSLTHSYMQASLDLQYAMMDTPDPKRAETLSPEFIKACTEKDFTKAAEIAEEIIERKGQSCTSYDWYQSGYCLYNIREYFNALKSFDEAIILNPNYIDAWNNRGVTLGNLRDYSRALESFDKVIQLDPDDIDVWHNRGLVFIYLKRYHEALESLDRAIQINPEDPHTWFSKGNVLFAIGEYNQALLSFNKVIQINPVYEAVWNIKGIVLGNLDDYAQALESFDKSLQLDPNDADVWHNRGVSLSNLRNYSQALESYNRAIELNPDLSDAWFNRADILLQMNQWDDFLQSVHNGLLVSDVSDSWRGDTKLYCEFLIYFDNPNMPTKIKLISKLYGDNNAIAQLAQGVIKSIAALFQPDVTQSFTEKWLGAWNAAGEDRADFVVALRLLATAVQWKKERDPRTLLTLAIEERRILEELLPIDEKTN